MVVEKIHQYPPVQTVVRGYPLPAPLENRAACCKGVYPPVKFDSPPDSLRESVLKSPFDEIPHEVADEKLLILSRKEHVEKEIHWLS